MSPLPRMIVTGGATGIGAAIATKGSAAGWDVIVLDRQQGPVGTVIPADLADAQATADALSQALSDGPVTRLVNNVGAVFPAALHDVTLDQARDSFELNVRTALQCTQAVLPGMEASGFGRIVNVASRAVLGKELRTVYAAAKAGLVGMTRVWALELASRGVTVNAIAPGPIATELFNRANPPGAARTRAIVESIPVGRLGTADDVARAAQFFLDDDAGFVTGQTLYVCGGLTVGQAGM